ncbi:MULTISPECIES: V-type ATP synthase subunit A [Aminobacterium]|jgi:V/A-type H+-transporting ATPase subunit A|uniref:V-type ATP synthase alpha chain n=1 Tax=Aminobacterium colombiense (strain DSM 12261 / ALA-1) TaxID=572547 RepID=D5EEX9_AMICL|nr:MULTISPECIES: V-type ATP synthase subunit A [Aminobacterium]ADE57111.1 H(+)-transporting two-sector ATPase [Aminobacterium colombiense DSM 12261]MDD2378312.1 V-type ATP synthase subunit A [Aminobacterium colombiense]
MGVASSGNITGISGPVIGAVTYTPIKMFEVAYIGHSKLLGEVIRIKGDRVDIQVYEDTSGLTKGEPVIFTGELLAVDLGPGILGSVFDGIGRPLEILGKDSIYLKKGIHLPAIDSRKKWYFTPSIKEGEIVTPGTFIGYVFEGSFLQHRIMAPPYIEPAKVVWVASEENYTIEDSICRLENGVELTMKQRWEVRRPRPVLSRLSFDAPLLTGQRILDTLFPIAIGGAAVLPGGFGTGKTVTQQSLAKWCNAEIIIYIGCGERGNEMTEVLEEFPELSDPFHNAPLMERMVLIANTSNMPVAAREASVYLGMTLAEYFRDMGYNTAIMADSTSRWAEALREIGGRLEEMPGEEGYPAYLGTRLAQYYERAGRAKLLGLPEREGSVTVINAVSPAGGDFSEPVTQASLRLSGAFWALDKRLAQQRHFPAINWQQSYTLYEGSLASVFERELGSQWKVLKSYLKEMLDREKVLTDLVQLVGRDGLSEEDKWLLAHVETIKVVFLQQNAYSDADASCSMKKQFILLKLLYDLDNLMRQRIESGLLYDQVADYPLRVELLRLREKPEIELEQQGNQWLKNFDDKLESLVVIPE